ncbi:MAG: hypothetical protein LBI36_00850 [Oscillospiraceae bacterium]|jgi:hypothetical protein|nr:hypothetical protein [Oscillospiraceae bacterium]
MNSFGRNEKNIEKMRKAGRVYRESDEDAPRGAGNAGGEGGADGGRDEIPFTTARKGATVCCGGFWFFSVVGMLFGLDFRAMAPFLFFSLAAVAFLNLPVFWVRRKYADFAIGIIAGLVCAAVGLSLLTA